MVWDDSDDEHHFVQSGRQLDRPYRRQGYRHHEHHAHHHAHRHRDQGVDQLGDFVTRRLLPELKRGSDYPVHIVMNFGTLYVQDIAGRNGYSNAVVYNAPGCTMIMGAGSETLKLHTHTSGLNALDLAGGLHGAPYGASHSSTSGLWRTCPQCGVRKVAVGGAAVVCRACEVDLAVRAAERAARREIPDSDYLRYPERRAIAYHVPVRY